MNPDATPIRYPEREVSALTPVIIGNSRSGSREPVAFSPEVVA